MPLAGLMSTNTDHLHGPGSVYVLRNMKNQFSTLPLTPYVHARPVCCPEVKPVNSCTRSLVSPPWMALTETDLPLRAKPVVLSSMMLLAFGALPHCFQPFCPLITEPSA